MFPKEKKEHEACVKMKGRLLGAMVTSSGCSQSLLTLPGRMMVTPSDTAKDIHILGQIQ